MEDLTITRRHRVGPARLRDGLKPADIDVVELYDAFTINTLLFLEDLGFCAKGEARDFIAGGAIAPGGCRSTPTAAGCAACIPACTAYSS